MFTRLLAISFLSIPYFSDAQVISFQGAHSAGIAHTSVTYADGLSIYNNAGSLGFLEKSSIATGYQNHYEVEGLNTVFAVINNRIKTGAIAIGVSAFGDELFSISRVSTGFGNRFGIAALGVTLHYIQYRIEGFGSHGFISVDVGGLAELSPLLFIGGRIKNINQAKVSKFPDEYYPTILTAGISYRPTDQLRFNTQIDKDLEFPAKLKFGLEYKINALSLRTGLNTQPLWFSFGFGFIHKKFILDYALQNNYLLGRTHSISIFYQIKN